MLLVIVEHVEYSACSIININVMKKIRIIIGVLIFIFYWIMTIIFTSPDNYIRIQLIQENEIFESLFFQKWVFFAPPPKHDDRIFFSFTNSTTQETLTFEAFEKISKLKSKNAPFNASEDIMDYIIGNSLSMVHNLQYDIQKRLEYDPQIGVDSSGADISKNVNKAMIQSSSGFQTLVNYGKVIWREKELEKFGYNFMSLSIGESRIKPFKDIDKIDPIHKDSLSIAITFESDTLNISR
jgi:hypothetical protein